KMPGKFLGVRYPSLKQAHSEDLKFGFGQRLGRFLEHCRLELSANVLPLNGYRSETIAACPAPYPSHEIAPPCVIYADMGRSELRKIVALQQLFVG
ncbi:MAG: hypothetical protein Q8L05_09480, partial [Actinomycetota bacterium]|nr:hypothetical protein [Actinomycetota bacterium]